MKPLLPRLVLLAGSHLLAAEPERREWRVDGVAREALVYAPPAATDKPAPVVFAFHGHGGTMTATARRYAVHEKWPDAIAVYPQGLNTPGRLTDPEGKRPGWQFAPGGQQDRDLKSFDAVLAGLKTDYRVDGKRVYATGHSNGGGFTYLLRAVRGDTLAGEADPLVQFEWQKAAVEEVRRVNRCEESGEPWGPFCTRYPSKAGAPVVTYVHPGDHHFPAGAEGVILEFFTGQSKP